MQTVTSFSTNGVRRFYLSNTGVLDLPKLPSTITANPSNVYVSDTGTLYKSTATMYSAEEVDKKLAIKDKLIEKLSARLDALEKRVK